MKPSRTCEPAFPDFRTRLHCAVSTR